MFTFALRFCVRRVNYPCRCLCFEFVQITRTTPRRRTTLHLSQMRLTDALTFIALSNGTPKAAPYSFSTIRARPGSFDINCTRTRSPTITRT